MTQHTAPADRLPIWSTRVPARRPVFRYVAVAAGLVAAFAAEIVWHIGSFSGLLLIVTMLAVTRVASDLRRIEVVPGGIVLRSVLGFRLREIPFREIVSATVIEAPLDDPAQGAPARRDRFVTRDGAALQLTLRSGVRILVSTDDANEAVARIDNARSAAELPELSPSRIGRVLPKRADDERSFLRRLTVVAVWIPLGSTFVATFASTAIAQAVSPAGRSEAPGFAILDAFCDVLVCVLGFTMRCSASRPNRLTARSSTPAWPLVAGTVGGAVALLIAPSIWALDGLLLLSELPDRVSDAVALSAAAPFAILTLASAVAGWRIIRRRPIDQQPDNPPTPTAVALRPTERAIWTGRFRQSRTLIAVWAFIAVMAALAAWVFMTFGDALIGVVVVIVVAALILISVPRRMRIDHEGAEIVGLFGIPLRRVRLGAIRAVRVDQVALTESDLDLYASWQRRFVTHAGDAIVITRTDRKRIVATVDDAPGAAGALLAFLPGTPVPQP